MTLEELKKNWKRYAIRTSGEIETILLANIYRRPWKRYGGGLLFILKDQPDSCDLLKSDENNLCYLKTSLGDELLEKWIRIGTFVKLGRAGKREK